MKPRYQWLLFDADGTLFDFERGQTIALEQSFQHLGVPFEAGHLKVYQQVNAEVWLALEQKQITAEALKVRRFELLLERTGLDHDPKVFSNVYLELLGCRAELIEGAGELMQSLHGKYRMAILTNGLQKVQRNRFARCSIREYVSEIIISEEIGFAKPAREYFDVAFARIGQPAKSEVVMIGDSWASDIRGAADYGIDTCWYNPTRQPRPPQPAITHEIAELGELLAWLTNGHKH